MQEGIIVRHAGIINDDDLDKHVSACLNKEKLYGLGERIITSLDKLVIAEMHGVGKGLFAHKAFERNEFVALYAGEYFGGNVDKLKSLPTNNSKYVLQTTQGKSVTALIDAHSFGGVARYIQHGPKQEEVDDEISAPDEIKQNIATVNLKKYHFSTVTSNGSSIPFIAFYATRDIREGEIFLFSYGASCPANPNFNSYWGSKHINMLPCFFTTKGTIIPRENIAYTNRVMHACDKNGKTIKETLGMEQINNCSTCDENERYYIQSIND